MKAPSASEFDCLCKTVQILLTQLDEQRINSRAQQALEDFGQMCENRGI